MTIEAAPTPASSASATRSAEAPAVTAQATSSTAQVPGNPRLSQGKDEWPLWAFTTPPGGKDVVLPPGTHATSLDLDPTGVRAVVIAEDGAGHATLYSWDYEHPLQSISCPALDGRQPTAVAFSQLHHDLYVTSHAGTDYRIDRFSFQDGTIATPKTIYRTPARLVRLVAPLLLYNGAERIYFGREYAPGRFQTLSVRADGTVVYEVTSPSGELTDLSDPALRAMALPGSLEHDNAQLPPHVEKAASALPVSLHPIYGSLLWEAADHSLRKRFYGGPGSMAMDPDPAQIALPHDDRYGLTNWFDSVAVPAARGGATLSYSPNGHFRLRTFPARKGAELVDPQDHVVERIGVDVSFTLPPVWVPSGRGVVAATQADDGAHLTVLAVTDRLAGVRYLPDILHPGGSVHLPPALLQPLSRSGMLFAETNADQIYQPYERLNYDGCDSRVEVPIFASVDGFLELLSAGFEATFMLAEQKVSRPRLESFLKVLSSSAKRLDLPRITQIAGVATKALAGLYEGPEGKRILAEKPAHSDLHTVDQPYPVDFGDFHPRGPYTATSELKNYFRAFKYINLLRVTPDESSKLLGDADLVRAFTAWVDTQRPFMSGSRHQGILDPDRKPPAHARPDCIPPEQRRPLLFPLSFGVDDEIMESTVDRLGVAADCFVPGRSFPEGLDLMTALGSPTALALQQEEYTVFPALKGVHESLRRRFAQPIAAGDFPEAWLRLVQLLGSEDYVPDGVDPGPWRRRLLSTALASWTSFRHTTVLVNEAMSAECGPGYAGFEELAREPARGAVDPVPESWGQLAALLDQLGDQAIEKSRTVHINGGPPVSERSVSEVLHDAAKGAREFRSMAERQVKGIPLSRGEYAMIQQFEGEVEHPYLLLKATLSDNPESLVRPDPMAKIVDVASDASGQHLHVAIGHPLQVMALLADRGIQVPASGAVYSYYELVDSKPLDDEQWRKRLDAEPFPQRPKWGQFELSKGWGPEREWTAPPAED